MASNETDDLYECQICMSYMMNQSPRTLHCLHTFCEGCLKILISNKTIKCPTCRSITTLTGNDVTLLPINFILGRMKKRTDTLQQEKEQIAEANKNITKENEGMKEILDEMESNIQSTSSENREPKKCDLCEKYKANYICSNCVKVMCALCKTKHDEVSSYKEHLLKKLAAFHICEVHGDTITHACLECARKLCAKCTVLNHVEHRSSFVGISEAERIFKDRISNKTKDVENMLFQMKNIQETVEDNKCILKEIRGMYAKKLSELDEVCEIVDRTLDKSKETGGDCVVLIDDTNATLANAENNDMCKNYDNIATKRTIIETSAHSINCMNDKISSFESKIRTLEFVTIKRKLKAIKVKSTSLSLHGISFSDLTTPITSLGSSLVLKVTNAEHLVEIDHRGTVIEKYYPQIKRQPIQDVISYRDQLYIAQSSGITVISNTKKQRFHELPLRNSKLAVLDEQNIVIVQDKTVENNRGIYQFNPDSGLQELTIPGITNPQSIKIVRRPSNSCFVVLDDRGLKIYNQDWETQCELGDNMTSCSFTTTDMNTILVCYNDKVFHYALNGKQLALDETTNQIRARVMEYAYPYLWSFVNPAIWPGGIQAGLYCYQII